MNLKTKILSLAQTLGGLCALVGVVAVLGILTRLVCKAFLFGWRLA